MSVAAIMLAVGLGCLALLLAVLAYRESRRLFFGPDRGWRENLRHAFLCSTFYTAAITCVLLIQVTRYETREARVAWGVKCLWSFLLVTSVGTAGALWQNRVNRKRLKRLIGRIRQKPDFHSSLATQLQAMSWGKIVLIATIVGLLMFSVALGGALFVGATSRQVLPFATLGAIAVFVGSILAPRLVSSFIRRNLPAILGADARPGEERRDGRADGNSV